MLKELGKRFYSETGLFITGLKYITIKMHRTHDIPEVKKCQYHLSTSGVIRGHVTHNSTLVRSQFYVIVSGCRKK